MGKMIEKLETLKNEVVDWVKINPVVSVYFALGVFVVGLLVFTQ